MRKKISKTIPALLAAAGLGALLPGPAWATSGAQPASGTFREASIIVDFSRVVNGNTMRELTASGIVTGSLDGTFTETDLVVLSPDGRVALAGVGVASGTLATCGTGSAPYTAEAQGTLSSRSGLLQSIDQAVGASTPTKISFAVSFTANAGTNEGTYTGTYHCD